MQKATALMKRLWNDESGQGATEYILLLVVVVAISMIFKDKIKEIVTGKLGELAGSIQGFTSDK